jgi:hypothetical protein
MGNGLTQIAERIAPRIVSEITNEIISSLRSMSFDDLAKLMNGGGAVLNGASHRSSGRRTSADIENTARDILKLLQNQPGLRAEEIRTALAIDKRNWLKPINAALSTGWVRKEGDKRATKYFAVVADVPASADAATPAVSEEKPVKKKASKKTKPAKKPTKKAKATAKAKPAKKAPTKKKAKPVKKTNKPAATKVTKTPAKAPAPSEPPDFPRPGDEYSDE